MKRYGNLKWCCISVWLDSVPDKNEVIGSSPISTTWFWFFDILVLWPLSSTGKSVSFLNLRYQFESGSGYYERSGGG